MIFTCPRGYVGNIRSVLTETALHAFRHCQAQHSPKWPAVAFLCRSQTQVPGSLWDIRGANLHLQGWSEQQVLINRDAILRKDSP